MGKNQKAGRRREPSLQEEIDASGETPLDAVRAALQDEQVDHKFLGREFLTWLIFYADEENGGGQFDPDDGGDKDAFRIQPGERVVLKALGEGAGEITAKGAAPAQTADVRYVIAGGLTVREADLLLLRGDRTWQLTATAEFFDVKRAKLPALLSEEDVQRAQERLELLDEMDGMIQAAYGAFLRERLEPAWDSERVPEIRAWLARSILEKEQLAVERKQASLRVPAPTPTIETPDAAADTDSENRPKEAPPRPWKRGAPTQVN
jgi:hypothetical protein